jgi:hypothetical protein
MSDATTALPCMFCGTPVDRATAHALGSKYACGVCYQPTGAGEPSFAIPERRLWPWIVGIIVVLAGSGIGIWRYRVAKAHAAFEDEYPYEPSDRELAVIDANLDRWRDNIDTLARVIEKPPAFESVRLTGPCERDVEHAQRFIIDRASADTMRDELRELVATAERRRFDRLGTKTRIVGKLGSPVLAIRFDEQRDATIVRDDPANPYYVSGTAAGTAYVFEPDGKVVCAGRFAALSADSITYTKYVLEHQSEGEKKAMDNVAKNSAQRILDEDLEARTTKAVVAGLRRVE